jgi:hypothetical protein
VKRRKFIARHLCLALFMDAKLDIAQASRTRAKTTA